MKKSTIVTLAAGLFLTGCASVQNSPSASPSPSSSKIVQTPLSAATGDSSTNNDRSDAAPHIAAANFNRPPMATQSKPVASGSIGDIQTVQFDQSAAHRGGCNCGPCSAGDPNAGQFINCQGIPNSNFGPHGYAMGLAPMVQPYGIDGNEFLCNGWDEPPRTFVQQNDAIGGLNPTDVAISYTSEEGDIEVSTSNEVCVYSPRFASVRKITGAVSGEFAIGLHDARRDVVIGGIEINEGGVLIDRTTELAHADVARKVDAFRDRDRGIPIERIEQLSLRVDNLAALANIRSDALANMSELQSSQLQRHALEATIYTVDQLIDVAIANVVAPAITRSQAAEAFVIYELPDAGRLEVLKVVDKLDAAPGDEISFAITARNVGDSPVDHIRLADNLTTRLEYIDGSQQSTPAGNFTTTENEVGSSRLIWTFDEPLSVGETITVRFTCRVR